MNIVKYFCLPKICIRPPEFDSFFLALELRWGQVAFNPGDGIYRAENFVFSPVYLGLWRSHLLLLRLRNPVQWLGRGFCQMGHFQLFSMILKFSMGHLLSFFTDFNGPFSKLMGLWRMAPCLPNHCPSTC